MDGAAGGLAGENLPFGSLIRGVGIMAVTVGIGSVTGTGLGGEMFVLTLDDDAEGL